MSSTLVAASVPLFPAVMRFWRGALAWTLRLLRGHASPKDTHAFVFNNCIHGNPTSVLATFDIYAETHITGAIGAQIGHALDEVGRRTRPSRVLELGTYCGYSSVLLLRLLPPFGRLVTVEQDPNVASLAEEIILVAGFDDTQFQVLIGRSSRTIPTLHAYLGTGPRTSDTFHMILMDHNPSRYLVDLRALEEQGLLCPTGCTIVLIFRNPRNRMMAKLYNLVEERRDCYRIKSQPHGLLEIFYKST
ncbi:transmembrane O-methyltransferase-like [Vanacampus margaritifer]